MIENNVRIEHRRSGVLVDVRELHNVWTSYGKEYLSELVALQVIDTVDIPQQDNRIKYLGLGIGGVGASGAAYGPACMAAYPPGFDPNASAGNVYTKLNPTGPPISTLERPIRVSGTLNPYNTAPGTDVWLVSPPLADPGVYYRDIHSVTFKFYVDASTDFVYGSLPFLPLSEAGLFHAGANVNQAYNNLVAYVDFASILLEVNSFITFSWTVRFAS